MPPRTRGPHEEDQSHRHPVAPQAWSPRSPQQGQLDSPPPENSRGEPKATPPPAATMQKPQGAAATSPQAPPTAHYIRADLAMDTETRAPRVPRPRQAATSCSRMKIDTNLTIPQLPEAPSQAGLQFAVATEEDFDEIMAMSKDIYGGLDYLPTRYTSWLQDTNRTVILARKEGKVIALESACVIDDGETMLVEGLRVAPQERGKGVAGVLLRFCSELVKSKYPDVKVTRLSRDDQLGPKDFEKYRIITKQGILLVRFRAEELKLRLCEIIPSGGIHSSMSTHQSSPPPVRLDQTSIHQLYLTTDLMQGVLPNATIIQDWQPFKLLPSNIAILLKKEIDWMVDDVSSPTLASLCTFPFKVPIGDDWYYLNIDMFGKDLNLAQQQFLCHLQRHTNNLKGHVMCQIFLEPGLWKPMADFCQNTLNVDLVKEYTEQCVVESDLV